MTVGAGEQVGKIPMEWYKDEKHIGASDVAVSVHRRKRKQHAVVQR